MIPESHFVLPGDADLQRLDGMAVFFFLTLGPMSHCHIESLLWSLQRGV